MQVSGNPSKEELFNRARLWFADYYKSSKDVLQISDRESGELVGKPLFKYSSRYFVGSAATVGVVNYTIKVFVKDGRYKYIVSDFNHEAYFTNEHKHSFGLITSDSTQDMGMLGKRLDQKVWREIRDMANEHVAQIAESLKQAMEKPSNNADSNW